MKQYELIQKLEWELIQPETRQSISRLSELLDNNFEEIGSSGKIYRKKDILKLASSADETTYSLSDFEFKTLCENCVLVKYKSYSNGVAACRSSIWIIINGTWKIVHHQSTVVKNSSKE